MLRRGLPGLAGQSLKQGGRVVDQHIRAFVGIDTSKLRNAVAVAEEGRDGEVRYLGEIDTPRQQAERRDAALPYRAGIGTASGARMNIIDPRAIWAGAGGGLPAGRPRTPARPEN